MPYNAKQYYAALDFLSSADDNVPNVDDLRRVQAYDLYENLYGNSTYALKIVLRGVDQVPMLVPSAKKIVNAHHRFLCKNPDYFVDLGGDEGTRQLVEEFWASIYKREQLRTKISSSVRWGMIRGDAALYVYANPNKTAGNRIGFKELDPRQIFEIENADGELAGYHIVEEVQDFREPDKPDKKVAKRRTFRKLFADDSSVIGITSELTYWEIGKWDDRDPVNREKMEKVTAGELEEAEYQLPPTITSLPIYKWPNDPYQNSSWGTSQLAGMETLMYGINQTLSDEDATIVFQGLGMYVTTAGPPRDINTGEVTSWNFGPKQVIEIGENQKFERVTGVSDMTPFTQHADALDKAMTEGGGTPEIAIGRVDVTVAESGIALQLQMMPLLASNAEKEVIILQLLDQFHHDVTTMWLPAYEPETFGDAAVMSEIVVVSIFDDPMPVDRVKKIEEIQLLDTGNLILKTMAIDALRKLGWRYPTTDAAGNQLTDDDIAAMLLNQQAAAAAALDPYAGALAGEAGGEEQPADTPDEQTIDLGLTE